MADKYSFKRKNSINNGQLEVLLTYNLQFFAKDGPGGEKTEDATSKKLSDARKEGQVAKSKDLGSAISLLAFFILLRFYIGFMGTRFIKVFNNIYTRIGELNSSPNDVLTPHYYVGVFWQVLIDMAILVFPFFIIALVLGVVIDLVQVKWKPTTKPLMPKFSKFNPISGVKKIFSVRSLVQLIKQVAMIGLIIAVIYSRLKNKVGYLYNLYDISLNSAIILLGNTILDLGLVISVVYIIIGIADYIFERRKFKNEMKMTKQEVKEEWKNTEGSPEVKQKQKQKMQEVSRRRMMQAVPEADVVITNPTHFAIALKYDRDKHSAPVVVAKGADYVAAKIKETAKENKVEIVENKPLARMLYYNVELGNEIPQELYQAVAEILAYVAGIKNKQF